MADFPCSAAVALEEPAVDQDAGADAVIDVDDDRNHLVVLAAIHEL
jgi:hypothetical protein